MGVFVEVFCHFCNKACLCSCLTMMLNWCFVTNNVKMSLLFLLFWAIPFLRIFSLIDVFLFFDDLGIFDCTSRVCCGNSMYCHFTINVIVFTASMNYWTDNKHLDHKQATKRNRTHTIDIYFKTSTWKSLVRGELYQDTSKQDIRTETKIFLAIFTENLRRLPCDRTAS